MTEFVWKLTAEQINHAKNEFASIAGGSSTLEGAAAFKALSNSGLPNEDLAKIWELADIDRDGRLSAREYAVAQFLIYARLMKQQLPNLLPGALLASLGSSSGGTRIPTAIPDLTQAWQMTLTQYQTYRATFQQNQVGGLIGGAVAQPLFAMSGVPVHLLAQIWNLADMDKDNNLSEPEFAIAMHLIMAVLAGQELPVVVPPALVQSVATVHKALITSSGSGLTTVIPPKALSSLDPHAPLDLPPLVNLTSSVSSAGVTRAELAKHYGVVDKPVEAYDATHDLRKLNDVTTIAEAEKLGIASEAQRKHLTEQLERESAVYQTIVAKGTAANAELENLIPQQNQLHSAAVELWNQAKTKEAELKQATEEMKSLNQLIQATTEGGIADPVPLQQAYQQMAVELAAIQQQGMALNTERDDLLRHLEELKKTIDPKFEPAGLQFSFKAESFPTKESHRGSARPDRSKNKATQKGRK